MNTTRRVVHATVAASTTAMVFLYAPKATDTIRASHTETKGEQ